MEENLTRILIYGSLEYIQFDSRRHKTERRSRESVAVTRFLPSFSYMKYFQVPALFSPINDMKEFQVHALFSPIKRATGHLLLEAFLP